MSLTLSYIRERLGVDNFDTHLEDATHPAAVAVILREIDDEAEVLLIKRAEHEHDPWSGHMAFPGGHVDPTDATPQRAAERETLEEIGLDLIRHARLIGVLEPAPPMTRIPGRNVVVVPHVYHLHAEPEPLVLNHEVAEVHWSPLGPMLRNENLTEIEWSLMGRTRRLPGFDVEGRVVWGMTFRMLNQLLRLIDPEYQMID